MNDTPTNSSRYRQRGQSTIEYAIISAALVVCLFATGSPAGQAMAQAIRTFYTNLTFVLSLP